MKSLKSIFIAIAVTVMATSTTFGQQYEYNSTNAKKLEIKQLLGKLVFEQHSGSKLIIEAKNLEPVPDKAKGLKPIYGGGNDNTGIGVHIDQEGDVILLSGASKQSESAEFLIKVPESLALHINYTSPFASDEIQIDGFDNELSIETLNEDIRLKNITGPVTLHTINGEIELVFSRLSQEGPTSISSIDGDIDISMPANTKAELEFSTFHGEIYTDFDIAFKNDDKEKSKYPGLSFVGGQNKNAGTINGGGVKFVLNNVNSNIYLRKK